MLLLLLLLAADEAAQAGAAYREALEAVRQARYDDAVVRLQDAIRFEPRETDRLQYRDKDGRQQHPYHPHFVWSQARVLQARAEKVPARQRQLYREAVTHLELTSHPQAPALLDLAKAELTAVEKIQPPAPHPLDGLRRQIGELCDREQFVEAHRQLALRKDAVNAVPGAMGQLVETIQDRRKPVMDRYERNLDLGLEAVAATSPLEKPESIPLLLEPALPPRTVTETPDARFTWLQEFLALYKAELPLLRAPGAASIDATLRCARAFEQSSRKALAAASPAGFRAALNVAHAVRGHRLQALGGGQDDATLDRVLQDSEQAVQDVRKGLLDAQAKILAPFAERLQRVRDALRGREQVRTRLQDWLVRAERAFQSSSADADLLKELVREESALEEHPAWTHLPAPSRARALFDAALLEAVAVLLDGEPLTALPERTAARLRNARALDADVRKSLKGRLSPKLEAWLEETGR